MKLRPRNLHRPRPYKGGMPYRPMPDWPYKRRAGDFRYHIDDLYFWCFIETRPFHCIWKPDWLESKNGLTRIREARRRGWKPFKSKRPYYKSRGRTPRDIQSIRYRSALNTKD